MKTIQMETPACTDIFQAAETIVMVARDAKAVYVTDFNGTPLVCAPSDNPQGAVERWNAERHRQQAAREEIAKLSARIETLKSLARI